MSGDAQPDTTVTRHPPVSIATQRIDSAHSSERIVGGPLAWAVVRFGLPLAIGMGLQTSFNLVDAYIIAGLGGSTASASLGAIGVADLIGAIGTILSYGLSVATGAIVSRRAGQRDAEGVRRAAWQSVLLLLGVGAVVSVLGIFGARALIVGLAGAKGQVAALGVPYLRVMMGGNFTIFLLLHFITLMRSLGSSSTPILLLVIANAANLFVAVLLVYGPGPAPDLLSWGPPIASALGLPRLELMGAAWATLIARCFALLPVFLVCLVRFGLFRRAHRTRPDLRLMRQIVTLGWPTCSQLVVRVLAVFLVLAVAQRLYTTAEDQSVSTALGLVLRLETMALYVGLGWGSAAQTFMGQNLGAHRSDRARRSGWYAAACNAAMMVLFAWGGLSFGQHFIEYFDRTPRVVEASMGYLRWVILSYPALGLGIVLSSAVQGAGATRLSLRLDLLVIGLVQLPLCVVAYALDWDQPSLWRVVALTNVAFAAVHAVSYRQGAFLKHHID
jgi:putative MATE family efflux protein